MSQRHLFNSYNITDEILNSKIKDLTIIDSITLLNPFRIDLIAKFIYIESKVLNVNRVYSEKLYKAHIAAFTHEKYVEQGQEGSKRGIESFYEVLHELILKIELEGFNPEISRVPIDKHGIILDGAHRTAVCAYFRKPLPVSQFNIEGPKYDYDFFKKRMMKPKYMDFMAHKYIQIKKKNLYTLCLWPKAFTKKDIIKSFLKNNFAMLYEKEVSLTPRGAHSFVSQIYHHHDWVGEPKNGFKGSKNKVNACFDNKNPLMLFVLETDKSLDEIIELKEEIRDLVGYGKHSIHITDNQKETVQISELLLNDNSVYHLNHANPFHYYKGIERFILFKELLEEKNHSTKEILVDCSGSMEVFGLREASDIDFVSNQNISKGEYYSKRTEEELFKLYGENMDSLQSPESYFYFFGIKFLTLDQVLLSKNRRGEKKDILDATILENYLKSNSLSKYSDIKFNIKRKWISWKKDIRMLIGKFKKNRTFNWINKILNS